LPLR
jgi:hypothetical protein